MSLLALNLEQQKALDWFKKGKNLFITGSGGCGKTVWIKNLIHESKGQIITYTSTTGISALHLGGKTIHSWSGIGLFDESKSFESYYESIIKKPIKRTAWKNTHILVIDEISMMPPEMLDCLDYIGRKIRNRDSEPFGGIQVILVGDFYQLPPINKENKPKVFAFDAKCWNTLVHHCIEFKHIYRQNDRDLTRILNRVRIGDIDNIVDSYLSQFINNPNYDLSNYTHIYPTKVKVSLHNEKMLQNIKDEPIKEYKYNVMFKNKYDPKWFIFPKDTLIEEILRVKKGAFVMVNKNLDFDAGIVNGTQGTIVGFNTVTNDPIVSFHNGKTIMNIYKEQWDFDGYTIQQYPLMLAYAITIHKSQGCSIERLAIDIGSNVFEEGQTYVALSRCVSKQHLNIMTYNKNHILTNNRVKDFYKLIMNSTS